jgi:hypothetical protein
MEINLLRLLENNVKITGIMIICLVGAYILVPKLPEVKKSLQTLTAGDFNRSSHNQFIHSELDVKAQDGYIPPNYGGPDSQLGSGTR